LTGDFLKAVVVLTGSIKSSGTRRARADGVVCALRRLITLVMTAVFFLASGYGHRCSW
jgi:hypothetical protein